MKQFFLIGLSLMFLSNLAFAQTKDSFELNFEKQYEKNIKKSRINGVYIPKDLEDAFVEMKSLSTEESLEGFKNGEEEVVVKKLHFGLGRWIMFNWNFYEGSRFSHYLKEKGVSHPDDQARFVITAFHRFLNEKDINEKELIEHLNKEREAILKARELKTNKKVLKSFKRKRKR